MKLPIRHIIFVTALLCLLHTNIFSQKINIKANRTRIFIGEQVVLQLSVEQGKMGMAWFQFADTLNHLEVVNRSKIDTVAKGGFTNYYQTITITSFDSGKWQFPALAIAGINQITMPITIDVVPVDVSQKKDYNDIKDIEEVQIGTDPIIIGILVALALFSLVMMYIFIQKKRKAAIVKPALKTNETPLQWALQQLNKLSVPVPNASSEVKQYYTELNNIGRTFFTLQLNENNKQLTTDEWMINLHKLDVDSDYKTSFFQHLRMGDSVRFAKYLPQAYENESAKDTVKNMLQKASLLHADIYSNYQPTQN